MNNPEHQRSDDDEVLASLTHDLSQPLFCIQATADMLLRGQRADDAKLKEHLRNIRRCSAWAQQLVDDLTDAESLKSGRLALGLETVPLADILRSVVPCFLPLCERYKVTILLQIPEEIGVVSVDRLRVTRVLSNLITNALKHMSRENGTIRIRAYSLNDFDIAVEVLDDGCGIEAQHLRRIFDKHYQVRSDSRTGGQGLGLYVAKQIVEAHGGHIWAYSGGLGRGTNVSFSLPKAQPGRVCAAAQAESRSPSLERGLSFALATSLMLLGLLLLH